VRYGMPPRPMPIVKYFGLLCIVLALLTIVPLTVSLWFGEYRVSFRYSMVVAGVFCLGLGLMRLL